MERARRTGTKKQSREAVRAALRAAREGGAARSDQWEAKEEKDVYEQVTEQEYADLVRKRRQNEDFVVDDDGLGYFDDGEEHAPLWQDAHTVAAGIRVPIAVGDFLILRAVRDSGGTAIAVEDDHIMQIRNDIARENGILLCPEGAATAAAYQLAMEQGLVSADETAILFNCATGLKYPMPPVAGTLDKDQPINFAQFVG